jgi:hypothetical protein
MSSSKLPAPFFTEGGVRDRAYIVIDGRVWSGILVQCSYDLDPPHHWEGFECMPTWRGRLDLMNIQEDKLPVKEPPPPPPPWWKVWWQRLVDTWRSQTVE